MAFKDTWRPRIDGVDDADSSAVNEIARAVIANEEEIKKSKENSNELWERTSCRTTKSGLTKVNITDADDTGDIYIKVTVVGEEGEGPSLSTFALHIWNFENQDEYKTYDISNGEIVIQKPYPQFIVGIPCDNRFYIEVTYNTSVSKGFDNLKEDVEKIETDMDSSLDLVIAQQESIIAQQESILAIQNSLIGGESV